MKRTMYVLLTACVLAMSPVGALHPAPAAAQGANWDEASYVGQVSGKTRFYRDGSSKQLLMVQGTKQVILHTTKLGILLTPHVYPVPGQAEKYVVWFEEQQGATVTNRLFVVNPDGTRFEIANLPQQGQGVYQLEWSPDGKRAFYLAENAENHDGVIGVIQVNNPHFMPLFGNIRGRATNPESVVGMRKQWHAAWTGNETLVLLDGRQSKGAMYSINASSKLWQPLMVKNTLPVLSMKPVPGMSDLILFDVGVPRYDVGFIGSQRTYLLNWKQNKLLTIPRAVHAGSELYDQQYMGLSPAKQLVISEVVKVGNQYSLGVITYDPYRASKQLVLNVALKTGDEFPVSYSFSPDGKYIAVQLNEGIGCRTVVVQTSNGVVVLDHRIAEQRQLGWKDAQTLLLGAEAVRVQVKK